MFLKIFVLYFLVNVCLSLSYDRQQDYLSSGSLLGSYPSLGYSPGNYLGLLGNKYSNLGIDGLPTRNFGNYFNRGLYPGLLDGLDFGLLRGTTGYNYLDRSPFSSALDYQGLGNGFSSLPYFGGTTIDGSISGILREYRQDPLGGSYAFGFESDNGIRRQESGTSIGPTGAVIKRGSYSFTHPDGTPSNYDYIADENGFRVKSNLLPTFPRDQGLTQIPGAAGIFDDLRGDDSPILRSAFINSHRQNSFPFSSARSLSGRLNDFDDPNSRTQRTSFVRERGPFGKNIQRDTFDASDPHTGGTTLSGHVKRENKSQDLQVINEKREIKPAEKSRT